MSKTSTDGYKQSSRDIAIIGMAGRFPGARDLEEFWSNLRNGVESIVTLSDEEVAEAGVPEVMRRDPNYVKVSPKLEDIDQFDAEFFDIPPREAEIIDPQQRLLLECAWEALENAGYDPEGFDGRIGIFAGSSMSSYLVANLMRNLEVRQNFGVLQLILANEKDQLGMRVAYKLNLTGPAVGVQSACSTSLVAVHHACDSLLSRQCDMALAGGAMIRLSTAGVQVPGYLYQEGGLASPDGHCRTFDAKAQGTVFGNGLGVVVLKPLSRALENGDYVHAVIKGTAVNNDGGARIGYTAPSVDGQAEVIAEALAVAGVEPQAISYVEAHGTGTPLGDPIEIAALNKVFRARTKKEGFCALGSVKTNIGHLEHAAGMAGLMKTVLALKRCKIPPHLHFEQPNPNSDLAGSSFFVPTELMDWPAGPQPRRAGVSSFGMGGTNAHVVLEEAPPRAPTSSAQPWQLLQLSARTESALEAMTDRLATALQEPQSGTLADVAFTLRVGRRNFEHRRTLVCRNLEDAGAALASRRVLTGRKEGKPESVFMFPGQGVQYVHMTQQLYHDEALFRDQVDYGARALRPFLGCDLREILYPVEGNAEEAANQLSQTAFTQPALFLVEHALARLMMSYGIEPAALIGHSIGEYVAATLAGVFTLEDALALVAARGRFMQSMPPGTMLAVALPEAELLSMIDRRLAIAAVNGPSSCVVAGADGAVEHFSGKLEKQDIPCSRLDTSHAFHSHMFDPVVGPFTARVSQVRRRPPSLPWISNVTGDWITDVEAVDAAYWGRQLRQTVRFAEGLSVLAGATKRVLVEVGPGHTLCGLVKRQLNGIHAVQTVRRSQETQDDQAVLLAALGRLWTLGVSVDFKEEGKRVPLPSYPFERKRHWIAPNTSTSPQREQVQRPDDRHASRYSTPVWVRSGAAPDAEIFHNWVLWGSPGELGPEIEQRLAAVGQPVLNVMYGSNYRRRRESLFEVRQGQHQDYNNVLSTLAADDRSRRIAYFYNTTDTESPVADLGSLVVMAQTLSQHRHPTVLWIVGDGIYSIESSDAVDPRKAAAANLRDVLNREAPHISVHTLDTGNLPKHASDRADLLDRFIAEISSETPPPAVAYRGRQRWLPLSAQLPAESSQPPPAVAQYGKVYLLTNPWSPSGQSMARHLVMATQAKLVLVDSQPAPPEALDALQVSAKDHLACCADITDPVQVKDLICKAIERFGRIHGLIYSPMLPRELRTSSWDRVEPTLVTQHLESIMESFRLLARAVDHQDLDEAIIWSTVPTPPARGAAAAMMSLGAAALESEAATWNLIARTNWRIVRSPIWDCDRQTLDSTCVGTTVPTAEALQMFQRILLSDTCLIIEYHHAPEGQQTGRRYADPSATGSAPAEDVEERIKSIWRQVLGVKEIGSHDNFFDLGGDSLLATQMATRLRERFHVPIALEAVFVEPTLDALVRLVSSVGVPDERDAAPRLEPVPRNGTLPLSFAQQRLFFLDQLVPDNPFYNVPVAIHIAGQLDHQVLAHCIHSIVERHEVLRTTFALEDGRPVQRVHQAMSAEMDVADVESLPESKRETKAKGMIVDEARRPFDLSRGPLIRTLLVRLGPQSHHLVVTMHHIVCDVWSLGVLLRDMAATYTAYSMGVSPVLPPLAVQYADFAVWQRGWLEGEVLEKHLAYWKRQLSDLPKLKLQPDGSPDLERTFSGSQQRLHITKELTQGVKNLGKQENATLFMVLLGVFQLQLHYHSAQDDIVVGTDVANRTIGVTEDLIGFFVNQLVLRTNLGGNPTFRQLLGRVRDTALAAYAHQDLPFDRIVEALNPPRNSRGTALFDVKIVLQNTPIPELVGHHPSAGVGLPGLQFTPLEAELGAAKFDLLFNLEETDEGIFGTLEYSTDLFLAPTVAQILEDFEILLSSVVESPDSPLNAIQDLLTRERRRRREKMRQKRATLRHEKLLKVKRKATLITSEKEEV